MSFSGSLNLRLGRSSNSWSFSMSLCIEAKRIACIARIAGLASQISRGFSLFIYIYIIIKGSLEEKLPSYGQ